MRLAFTSIATLASLLFVTLPGHAATLGLITGSPSLVSDFAFIDYLEFGPDGDLSTFGAEIDDSRDVAPVGFAELGFGIGFSLADPESDASGGFDVYDDNGLFLGGDLLAVGFTEDVIELQFDNIVGAAAASFGSSVLATINFDDPLGDNPFAAFFDGDFYLASIEIASVQSEVVNPIPLPSSMLFLASGLLGAAALRRRI